MSGSTRCAACKSLRRKCTQDCFLAPFFPATNPHRFACVHKIFGASNVIKMLQRVPEAQRREASDSIYMEAKSRIQDPIYGCVGMISSLQAEIFENQQELARTLENIALYKAQGS